MPLSKVVLKKQDVPVVLDLEQFGHLEYLIVKIEQTEVPSISPNGTCFRYVVANDVSEVTGYRQGTKEEVAEYCETLIFDLNLRTVPKKKL